MHKRGDVAYILLGVLTVVGVVAALAIAPGIGAALKLIDPNPRKAVIKAERAFRSLVKSNKVIRTKGGYIVTTKGEREYMRQSFDRYQFPESAKWDKKWRVICFDIPERNRGVRYILHNKLKELGCFRLQDSVFVTPHACVEFTQLLHKAYGLYSHVRVMVVTEVDDEQQLRAYFRLGA